MVGGEEKTARWLAPFPARCLLYMGVSPLWFLLIVENSNLTQIVILGKGSLQITVWQSLAQFLCKSHSEEFLTNNANKGGDPRGWDWMSALLLSFPHTPSWILRPYASQILLLPPTCWFPGLLPCPLGSCMCAIVIFCLLPFFYLSFLF